MSNRKQRRDAKKASPRIDRVMSKQEQLERLVRNGITASDLEVNYNKGFNAGRKEACEDTYIAIYAGICLAANEEFGFGSNRCIKLLRAVDDIVLNRLTTVDLIEAVYERMHIKIVPDDAFDRIVEV